MATLKHFRIGLPYGMDAEVFPWLKSHGHIEAIRAQRQPGQRIGISMAEKSWPH